MKELIVITRSSSILEQKLIEIENKIITSTADMNGRILILEENVTKLDTQVKKLKISLVKHPTNEKIADIEKTIDHDLNVKLHAISKKRCK